MKFKLFVQAVIFSLLLLFLAGGLSFYKLSSFHNAERLSTSPRRYLGLESSHNFNGFEQASLNDMLFLFDNIFFKALYIAIIIQSYFIIRKLKTKSIILVIGFLLSSLVGVFSIFTVYDLRYYFVTGLNPVFVYVPVFFLISQFVIWIYLNYLLFRKIAEKNSER